ncbi:MAG: thiosulfohydrolase SoxB [Geminicoccaceae bacterium]|nr:thiosulfohydrolase SoxB [Geminicoccaceae bacterium]MDW8124779.1 thiosulfohydrolase SoxB [Geminicoccaceae bacterium]
MVSRRDFVALAAAAAAIVGPGRAARLAARDRLTEAELLAFRPVGNVTILHLTDLHAQLLPLWFREPSTNIGVGEVRGLPPHLTGEAFLARFRLARGTPEAYAFTDQDFVELARRYGRVGGLDRIATLVKAIRAERPGRTLLLDGGDAMQGSWVTLKTKGADIVAAYRALGVDAMTAHWEFTFGAERVKEIIDELGFPFLAGNVLDTEWQEPVFESTAFFERGGVKIAVIGQAFPYTPVSNPRWMIPQWSFGIREERVAELVENARAQGAELVVLLSHNGFDVDRKLVSRVPGIDVVLTGHTHDALPEALVVGKTIVVGTGSHGKFLARLDLDVRDGAVKDWSFRLVPVFADAIRPDPEMAELVARLRAPFAAELERVLGRTKSLLYRRGNFQGSWDDLICAALLEERDAEIALSPGFRWGPTLLPDEPIRMEDVWAQTAITYPQVYRIEMTGAQIKEVLEDVADNIFNPDPYYQGGGDMVRVGGLGFAIDVEQPIGKRISDMTSLATGEPIDPARRYVVAGWASVNEGVEGPPVWELVARYIARHQLIEAPRAGRVIVKSA